MCVDRGVSLPVTALPLETLDGFLLSSHCADTVASSAMASVEALKPIKLEHFDVAAVAAAAAAAGSPREAWVQDFMSPSAVGDVPRASCVACGGVSRACCVHDVLWGAVRRLQRRWCGGKQSCARL